MGIGDLRCGEINARDSCLEAYAAQLLVTALSQLQTIYHVACDQDVLRIVIVQIQEEIAQLEWEWAHDEWEAEAAWYEQAIHERRALASALTVP